MADSTRFGNAINVEQSVKYHPGILCLKVGDAKIEEIPLLQEKMVSPVFDLPDFL